MHFRKNVIFNIIFDETSKIWWNKQDMIDPTTVGLAHVVAFGCGISFGFDLNNGAHVAF